MKVWGCHSEILSAGSCLGGFGHEYSTCWVSARNEGMFKKMEGFSVSGMKQ